MFDMFDMFVRLRMTVQWLFIMFFLLQWPRTYLQNSHLQTHEVSTPELMAEEIYGQTTEQVTDAMT